MIYKTDKSEIAKYRENESLSQSDLKKLLGGLENFLKEEDKQTLPMIIGSAVDALLTGTPEEFEDEFHIISVPKPSELMESMLLSVYENSGNKEAALQDLLPVIEEVVVNYNYQSNWKLDTRIGKVLENFVYYEEIKQCAGKTVLSPSDMEVINNVVDSLRTNNLTKSLFMETDRYHDIYYQLPLFWELDGIKCKGLLDIVVVEKDFDGNVISVTPYDLKTLSDKTINFGASVKMRRYDIQAAWYSFGLRKCLAAFLNCDISKLKNFRFVVESTTNPGEPLIYVCSDDILNIGTAGLPELIVNGRLVRNRIFGFMDLFLLYKYYQEQGFQRERAIEESNGLLTLDWDYSSYQYKDTENENPVWKKI